MNSKQTTYISNPFKVIFSGFGNLFKYNQNLSIILLVASVFMSGGSYIPGDPIIGTVTPSLSDEQITAILIIVAVTLIILVPIIIFLTTMYNGIAAYTVLKTAEQKTTTFKEAWAASLSKFWIILGINVVVGLKVIGGLLLFVVPGIRAMLRYNMVHLFIFDQDTGIKESITRSKALTKDHLIEIFGMTFAAGIIPIVGGLMAIGGQSVMYPQLTQLKSTAHSKPPVHWLNYLAFIVFGGLFAFIVLIATVIGLALS